MRISDIIAAASRPAASAAVAAVLIASMAAPASAKVSRCDVSWVSCTNTAAKCYNSTKCYQRCDQKYRICSK
ncbi:hypothetical protein KMZ68_03565 [Bradyrhizobium sediminis]|uniref:DUF3551 domain-containing protein n=1 Tax=Bradyrhizobium sediminis TaxID=2840469 RepID=A0A975RTH0_9BRAD|nr:hypothetical protein [Bradyrhizobium sediminis]QWG18973.1 hypothetical protein KMZ68_03565 [Bradyrhizobium sediminis]